MIWKLIRKNISALQIAGYALASIVGLSIVLCSVKFYLDARSALADGENADSQFIVVARPATMLGSLGLGSASSTIDSATIAEIRRQPWARRVGSFTAASFGVTGSVEMMGRNMFTQLFLESVPDYFIDASPQGWDFDPADSVATVPVIVPRDYLSLYNYGYAASQGLPQLTEDVVTQIPFNLYFNGNGRTQRRSARIAAFSDRINTIAVPERFLQWANTQFSAEPPRSPSRIIIELDRSADSEITSYLSGLGLEPGSGAIDRARARSIVELATAVVSAIGIAICALALFILTLSTSLLLQKNKEKNSQLLLLGFSPAQVAAPYMRLTIATNATVLAIACAAMLLASRLWQAPLASLGQSSASATAITLAIGAALMLIITAIAARNIRCAIR